MSIKTFKKSIALFLASFMLITGGNLLYKDQTRNVKAADSNIEFTELNVTDKTQMYTNSYTTLVGNVCSFGPSIGAFASYKSKNSFENLKMEFESSLDPKLTPDWQRVVLRAPEIDASLNGEVVGGYFVALYANNYHLYKQRKMGEYISLSNQYYPDGAFENKNNIYDGKFYNYEFRVYNENEEVHLEMYVNNVTVFKYVDRGGYLADGKTFVGPMLNAGHAGFYMNSTGASWILRSKITDNAFSPNIFLGNVDTFDSGSTAEIKNKELNLSANTTALVADELSISEFEFDYTASSAGTDNKLFSIATLSNKKTAKDYSTNDGIITDFYLDTIKIRWGSNEVGNISFATELNKSINIKYISFYIAGRVMISISINGTWHTIECKDFVRGAGYVSLYGFGNVKLIASDKLERNYRVLFIGNSITNHGPNADIGYHIGTTTEPWAMATSAPEFDYVHRTVKAIREIPGYEETEYMAINVANWEGNISQYDFAGVYQEGAEFEADLIVGRLGENVITSPSAIHFEYFYNQLLNFFNSTGKAKIMLTTKYWGSSNNLKDDSVDTGTINLARHNNYPLVRLNDLGSRYESINNATADYDYYHSLPGIAQGGLDWGSEFDGWSDGVKQHPGMVGHENIGARVSECAVRLVKNEDATISKLIPMDEDLSVEINTSNIKEGEAGAYDIKAITSLNFTPITDFSSYTLSKNYVPFKGFDIETNGTPYRFQMTLDEDKTAQLTYKAYTLNSDGRTLKELQTINNADSVRDGILTIEGNINKKLIIAVEYDLAKVFPGNTVSDTKVSTILNFVNKDKAQYTIDLKENGSRYLTIDKDMFSTFIASGRDILINLKDGSFLIERKTFETIATANKNLTFAIEKYTSKNDKQNATSVINSFEGVYGLENQDELVTSVYQAKISYNGRNGDPLYISSGVKVLIDASLSEEQANALTVVTAKLPTTGSEVTNVGVLAKSAASYKNGVISIDINNFDRDLILAYSEHQEAIVANKNTKLKYSVNEEFPSNGLSVTVTNLLGQEKEVILSSSDVENFDTSSKGQKEITLNYNGIKSVITINVEKAGCGGSLISSCLILTLASAIGCCLISKRKEENN